MPRRDPHTIDLFREFEPPPVVERYDPERVRAASLPMLIARAISETLREHPEPRAEIAKAMTEYLGEPVTVAMLDKYASLAASSTHAIPAHRLVALAVVTGDARLINALVAQAGLICVGAKYEALVRRELAKEAQEKLAREIAAADAQWRAGR